MNKYKLKSEANPSLVVVRDNKTKWYLPETRRAGYRNLHKINRYGLLYRSDLVLKLNKKYNKKIQNIPSVKKIINHKYFCSLLVGKDQDILFEKYASDFTNKTPQTIMSITKMFVNLFIGELVKKKIIKLNHKISKYLPNIGTGYAKATIQDVLDMNIENAYSEDYTDPYTSSYMHEPVCGWRLPKDLNEKIGQEEFLNKIKANKGKNLNNKTGISQYKSANTDVLGLLIEKVSKLNKVIKKNQKNLTKSNLFIFGIKPTIPSSEYGYFYTKKIKGNINRVSKFIEKPNLAKAKQIISKKGYWNSGMLFLRKDSIIYNFKKYQPSIYRACSKAVSKAKFKNNVYYLNKKAFIKIPAKSFDYAILEKSKDINAINLNIPWSDLGSWKEILNIYNKNKSKYFKKSNVFLDLGADLQIYIMAKVF